MIGPNSLREAVAGRAEQDHLLRPRADQQAKRREIGLLLRATRQQDQSSIHGGDSGARSVHVGRLRVIDPTNAVDDRDGLHAVRQRLIPTQARADHLKREPRGQPCQSRGERVGDIVNAQNPKLGPLHQGRRSALVPHDQRVAV